ncbi:MAG: serine/threonine-protein kinase RsbW [Frankiales bacterium]|jgi:serine/threonine-protein kinase RsbW|nr:serine/threonine-protein kinase RsbW [Frankiales bacterium]
MQIKLSLSLPRDEMSVPVSRRIAAQALATLGVEPDCISDIEVALTEACTNVLDHVGADDEYDVTVGISGDLCVIEVIDTGHGFDAALLGLSNADASAEQGRGIQLIRALVDRVQFTNRPEQGTIVHLEKDIVWTRDALLKVLDNV